MLNNLEEHHGEEDFIQWVSRLLLENQRLLKNQPIKYFKSKRDTTQRDNLGGESRSTDNFGPMTSHSGRP